MKRVIFHLLALVGAITLLAVAAIATAIVLNHETGGGVDLFGAGVSSTEVKSQHASPDGISRVLHILVMSGSAAGSCRQFVTVLSAAESEASWTPARARAYAVLEVSCGSELKAEWASSTQLKIDFTVPSWSGADALMRRQDKTGRIKVQYVLLQA